MSEKRFKLATVCGDYGLYDTEDGCIIVNVRSNIDLEDNWNTVVEKLNEQQDTISALKEENDILKQKLRKNYIANKQYEEMKRLQEENEQLRKIGVMYQSHNPCETCTYSLEDKVCCAEPTTMLCIDAKKNFIQGLCKNHKQFQKSWRRYDE